MNFEELIKAYNELINENTLLKAEIEKLRKNLNIPEPARPVLNITAASTKTEINLPKVHNNSSPGQKIELFMSLFRGRTDVFARRWQSGKTGKGGYQPACGNEWRKGLCGKPKIKCSFCSNRKLIPLDKSIIEAHLRGESAVCKDIVGVYPLMPDETCYFLAADFDGENHQKDIAVFRGVCDELNISVAIERSRSGNGAHAWFFFDAAVSAAAARKFGSILITRAMNMRHDIGFKSYDRLLPNQDIMPKGGFGNLIALPLQGQARKLHNSVFIDENFMPYADQWAYLSGIKKLSSADVEEHINKLCVGNELGILAKTDEDEKPWEKSKPEKDLTASDFPANINIVRANMIFIEKHGISQKALNRIKRLGAFKNPEFYKAQAMRLPTHDKSRIISTADETEKFIGIPRGCEPALIELLNKSCGNYFIDDQTNSGTKIKVDFNGELNGDQIPAAKALSETDIGVLSATTAFGKTVVGAKIIADKKVNTLIMVHTQALLTQWKKALEQFLVIDEVLPEPQAKKRGRKVERSVIGQLGAGKNKLSGVVDIAVMQSLINGEEVKELVKDYGMVIVDECHHVSALTFEKILKAVNAKYVYGLTATPTRQDGHQPIIFMQCGPIRYKVDARTQADKRPFDHFIIPRFTSFKEPVSHNEKEWSITQIYSNIAESELRNRHIVSDAIKCLEAGRSSIILTGRSAHVTTLADMLKNKCPNIITLVGSASQKEKRETMQRLNDISKDEPLIIVATGKYVGEGFDCPRLDTLLLAMPIAWKGTIAQYAGRLHRLYEGKNEVLIYDYVDIQVPVLERMYHKRVKGYAQIGYKAKAESAKTEKTNIIFDDKNFMPVFSSDIAAAVKEIVIVSPFMRMARIKQMLKLATPAIINGAAITVVTRHSDDFTGDGSKAAY